MTSNRGLQYRRSGRALATSTNADGSARQNYKQTEGK